jgi:hypothetical protein
MNNYIQNFPSFSKEGWPGQKLELNNRFNARPGWFESKENIEQRSTILIFEIPGLEWLVGETNHPGAALATEY